MSWRVAAVEGLAGAFRKTLSLHVSSPLAVVRGEPFGQRPAGLDPGHLLAELGRRAEARAEFDRAATLTGNARERALFRTRAAQCEEP